MSERDATKPPSVGRLPGDAVETIEREALLTAVRKRYGYDFAGYSQPSLRRRLRRAVKREGVAGLSELQGRVLRDRAAFERFLGHVSVGVTSMFRDPEFFATFRREVVPTLRTWPSLRIWHAGCASGEEVYSMAILLEEEGLYDRTRLYATDLSQALLDRARKGVLPLGSMRDYTANYQEAGGKRAFSDYYLADSNHAVLDPSLRRNMVFMRHNLVSDEAFNDFHVVLCRNVIIYFGRDLRRTVHGLLRRSLVTYGVLGLGAKENIHYTPHEADFTPIRGCEGLYRLQGRGA
jgi:chemotaxis protein methyltransferase CheR